MQPKIKIVFSIKTEVFEIPPFCFPVSISIITFYKHPISQLYSLI